MSNKQHQQNMKVEKLKAAINGLIIEYEEAHTLLNDQMQAVINNDILSLNQLIEKQVAAYESLQQSETQFKKHLGAFLDDDNSQNGEQRTLRKVLERLDEPADTLNTLRERLHTQVQKTERLRAGLVDLLAFAQQQNAEVFKAICTLASDESDAYDDRGKKKLSRTNGLAINQRA